MKVVIVDDDNLVSISFCGMDKGNPFHLKILTHFSNKVSIQY